jgi:signal transduction histidine kinase
LAQNLAPVAPLWQRRAMPWVRFASLRLDQRIVLIVRAGLLVVVVALTLVQRHMASDVFAAGLLVGLALAASVPIPPLWRPIALFAPVAEAVIACCVMLLIEPLPETMLPYLLAPALAAGLIGGTQIGVMTTGLGAFTLLLGQFLGTEPLSWSDYLAIVSRWTLITLAVGLLGAWVGRLQLAAAGAPAENLAYEAAYRLISQLRLVARQLSGGLDPVSLGQQMLEAVHRIAPFDRGAVYVRSTGSRLAPVAFLGADRLEWDVESPLFDEAWASSTPMRSAQALTPRTTGYSAVLPLRIGLRTFGLLAIERSSPPPFEPAQLADSERVLEELGLRLETALLFSEVRSLATAEERRRLAREIHDGIAQELASMGYVVDDLAARARYLPDLEADLKTLRSELTRVITELRLSIFDLRSEVQTTTGLGTALSDYVRQVGAGSKLTVHLVLDESPVRLGIDAETELLRIAQEAVTNARKHANAHNLWVTCRVDPPTAYLAIEDDGAGLGRPRDDSFGLEVMRERAERIGAKLHVGNREEGGTAVEVTLGGGRHAG